MLWAAVFSTLMGLVMTVEIETGLPRKYDGGSLLFHPNAYPLTDPEKNSGKKDEYILIKGMAYGKEHNPFTQPHDRVVRDIGNGNIIRNVGVVFGHYKLYANAMVVNKGAVHENNAVYNQATVYNNGAFYSKPVTYNHAIVQNTAAFYNGPVTYNCCTVNNLGAFYKVLPVYTCRY